MAKILTDVNALIRLASKQADKDISQNLYELQNIINEELYEEI